MPSPVKYAIAFLAAGVGWLLNEGLTRFSPGSPASPFLPGLAAVMAVAACASLGPGLLATALTAGWCALSLKARGFSLPYEVASLAIFVSEGVLLSVGGARLRTLSGRAAAGEAWHRSLVETSGEGIWTVDGEGLITWANPRIGEILGIGAADLAGRKMEDFLFPAEVRAERIRLRNRRPGLKDQFDRRLRRVDGSEAWLLTCASTLAGTPGSPGDVLSMMTDITERKLAEQTLRRSERRFRGLFENVVAGVYQTTPEGRITAANPMLLRMLGLASEAELNEVGAHDLYIDPAMRPWLTGRLEREGSFQDVEYELRRRDGRVITVRENARVVRDEEGRVLYYEGTLTDITESRKAESQLRHTLKMEALSGSVARDFSKLLNVMSENARFVLEHLPATHLACDSAREIGRAVESAAAFTRQLLAFSRSRNATRAAVDLNTTIREATPALRQIAQGRASLHLAISATPALVFVDRVCIEYMAMTLVLNAIQRGRREGCIEFRTQTAQAESCAAIVVTASDWDPGSGEGEGGTATWQALAAQHDGFTARENLDEERTSFSIFFPLSEAARPDDGRDPVPEVPVDKPATIQLD
ncbi:MAG: PAS domain S-box protein [Acidobacteriota bacterium]